jgi:hypothetical protein
VQVSRERGNGLCINTGGWSDSVEKYKMHPNRHSKPVIWAVLVILLLKYVLNKCLKCQKRGLPLRGFFLFMELQ